MRTVLNMLLGWDGWWDVAKLICASGTQAGAGGTQWKWKSMQVEPGGSGTDFPTSTSTILVTTQPGIAFSRFTGAARPNYWLGSTARSSKPRRWQHYINVVHFVHNSKFTEVLVSACWKDHADKIQQVVNRLLVL